MERISRKPHKTHTHARTAHKHKCRHRCASQRKGVRNTEELSESNNARQHALWGHTIHLLIHAHTKTATKTAHSQRERNMRNVSNSPICCVSVYLLYLVYGENVCARGVPLYFANSPMQFPSDRPAVLPSPSPSHTENKTPLSARSGRRGLPYLFYRARSPFWF